MSSKQRRLEVVIAGDAKSVQEAFGKVGSAVGGLGSKLGGFAKGAVAAFGAAFAVDKLVDFGGQILGLGAKLTAWRTKTVTVFEDQAGAVQKWADANNEAFGVTDDELAGLAASFGDLLKPMGFTAGQAADMSKKVVGLSGALSAWSGGTRSAAEVSEILAKAMLGERDSLKELGISIMDADVDARLLAKGQDKLTGSALEQAKAIATQELIFEKSTDAQKAWAAGGNEALNAQNRLKAVIGEAKERLATGLLPVLVSVATYLSNTFGPVVTEIAGGIGAFVGAFRDPGGGITSGGLAGQLEAFGIKARAAFDQITAKVREWWPSIRATLVNLASRARETFDQVAAKVREWWPKIKAILQAVVAWVRDNWPKIRTIATEVLTRVQELFTSAFGTVRAIVETVVKIVMDLWRRFGEDLLARLSGIATGLIRTIRGLAEVLTGIFDLIKAILTGRWGEAWAAIQQIVAGAWNAIAGIVQTAWHLLLGAIQLGLATLSAIWSLAWNSAKTLLGDAWAGIKALVSGGIEAVVGLVTGLPGRIKTAVAGMWDGIWEAFKSAINKVIRGWNKLSFTLPTIDTHIPGIGKIGGWTLDTPNISVLHTGGRVPGIEGEERLAVVRGGEWMSNDRTSSLSQPRRSDVSGPIIGNINIYGSALTARDVADEIAWRWRIAG